MSVKTSFWMAGMVLPAIVASAAYADDANCRNYQEDVSVNGMEVERDYSTVCTDANGYTEVSEDVPVANAIVMEEQPVLVSEWVDVCRIHLNLMGRDEGLQVIVKILHGYFGDLYT